MVMDGAIQDQEMLKNKDKNKVVKVGRDVDRR